MFLLGCVPERLVTEDNERVSNYETHIETLRGQIASVGPS